MEESRRQRPGKRRSRRKGSEEMGRGDWIGVPATGGGGVHFTFVTTLHGLYVSSSAFLIYVSARVWLRSDARLGLGFESRGGKE